MAQFERLEHDVIGALFLSAALGRVFFPGYGREWVSLCNAMAMLMVAWLWIFSKEANEEDLEGH